MADSKKIGTFIMSKRKELGFTQHQLADRLNISFQAISKWETGSSLPNVELLQDLAAALNVSVDEILSGNKKYPQGLSYSQAGIDIAYTDHMKCEMAKYLETDDKRVLNGIGPFASLYDISFPEIREPVLVLKSEEPGSKQKLAMEYGYTESICHDMVNHLVNDILVMGARPLAVLDTIICGSAEKDTINTLIKSISCACRKNDCSLVGGETSIQPQVVSKGVYILTSSIAGIIERQHIIDGTAIEKRDCVIAVASNGLHTNGYSLVRLLMEKMPQVKLDKLAGETFLEQVMKPHTSYYQSVKGLLGKPFLHGMAHITGGGIEGNLSRVIPDGLCARIDLSKVDVPPIFKYIQSNGNVNEHEMLATFNCGVGFILIVSEDKREFVLNHISKYHKCMQIGEIKSGQRKISFINELRWK